MFFLEINGEVASSSPSYLKAKDSCSNITVKGRDEERFEKVLKHNKLPKIRFHDLRHTAGSMLVNSGHTIKQVQEFLGHEKASTTLDIYTHVSLEGKKNTAQVLDELLA